MNRDNKKPKELNEYVHEVVKEPDYSNVVGQDSLNRFEHTFKNKKKKKKPANPNRPVDNSNRERQSPAQNPTGEQKAVAPREGTNNPAATGTAPNPANKRRNKRPNNRGRETPNSNSNETKE
jgi:hypothetical protein